MKEKYKLTKEHIEKAKKDEMFWRTIQLSVLTSMKSEESGLRVSKVLDVFDGGQGSVALLSNMAMYLKTIGQLQILFLSITSSGEQFDREEYLRALSYNSEVLNEITMGILDDKKGLEEAMEYATAQSIPRVLMEMLMNDLEEEMEKGNGGEKSTEKSEQGLDH